jgi:NAD(P)-dependent dehydrogenase (short-subunit alcohol dehydrogenase family)
MKNVILEMFSLEDKVVVLTGAGGTLVGEMAKTVAACGAKVAVLDLNIESAEAIANKINRSGAEAIAIECNVLDRNNLLECKTKIIKKFSKIDCLVNGAGGNKKEATTSEDLSFFEMPVEANKWVFDLNFMGTLLPCQIFGKEIVKQPKGSIVNIASIAGFKPLTRASAYAAAKAAVINFTQWLAVHMCQNYSTEIRVNAIAPGFCATEQNRYLLFDDKDNLTARGKTILSQVPQNRFGKPIELTSALIWLLSDSSSFVTGSSIIIDGGFNAFSGV